MDKLTLAVISSAITIVYILVNYFTTQQIREKNAPNPQDYPARIPIKTLREPVFGTDDFLAKVSAAKRKGYLDKISSEYKTFGWTYCTRPWIGATLINTIDPANIHCILNTNFHDYLCGEPRKHAFAPLMNDNSIILCDGPKWKRSRSYLRPSFERSLIHDLPKFEHHVQILLEILPKDGSIINLAEFFYLLTADITTEWMFGQSIDSMHGSDKKNRTMSDAFKEVQEGCETRWRLGIFADLAPLKTYYAAIKEVHAMINVHVREALEFRNGQLLHIGSDKMSQDTEQQFVGEKKRHTMSHLVAMETDDEDVLRANLISIFFGGRDTTAATLTNLFHTFARRPDVWANVQDEVSTTLAGRVPEICDLNSMNYLRWCINEVLRLYPVISTNSRVAARDTVLPCGGGIDGSEPVFVKKGEYVAFHIQSLHKRKDLWGDDADEFRPERWERESHIGKYFAFGVGPRKCPGQQFAITETLYVVARLAQEFAAVDQRDYMPWQEQLGITMTSAHGAKVSLKPKHNHECKLGHEQME